MTACMDVNLLQLTNCIACIKRAETTIQIIQKCSLLTSKKEKSSKKSSSKSYIINSVVAVPHVIGTFMLHRLSMWR